MKKLSVIALVLALSGVSFAQANPTPAKTTETAKPTAAATVPAPEKTADVCKGLEGTKLQECWDAQKAKGTTAKPATTTEQPAQQ